MFIIYSESDYAVITREFEDHVDDKVLEAVRSATSADAVVSVGATITADANVDNLPAP
jgi:L-ascorbate metabolism protein UlaG (beta-lactamase superfamily)